MIISTLAAGTLAALTFGAGLLLGLRRRDHAAQAPDARPQPRTTAVTTGSDGARYSPDQRFAPGWVERGRDRRVVLVNRLEDERRMLADRRLATAL